MAKPSLIGVLVHDDDDDPFSSLSCAKKKVRSAPLQYRSNPYHSPWLCGKSGKHAGIGLDMTGSGRKCILFPVDNRVSDSNVGLKYPV